MKLDSDKIQSLRLHLSSTAWRDVMKPALAERGNRLVKSLILAPSERAGDFKDTDDNFIRGRIAEIEWIMTAFENEVRVHDHNRRLDELDAAEARDNGVGLPRGVPSPANP